MTQVKGLWWIGLISLLLSAWAVFHETTINPDGICYVVSAEALTTFSLKQAMQLCPQSHWPFYQILIYSLAKVSHLSFLHSAYVINAASSLLAILAFIFIVKEMGGSSSLLILAAATILLAHDFNSLRSSIIRDHAYWAAYLWSIALFLRYLQNPRMWRALVWSFTLLIASLFRIEGFIFLFTLPFVYFILPNMSCKDRIKNVGQLYFLPVVLAGIIYSQAHVEMGRLVEIPQVVGSLPASIFNHYVTFKHLLGTQLLTDASPHDLSIIVISTWLIWYVLIVTSNLTWCYTLLLAYLPFAARLSLERKKVIVIGAYIFINIAITLVTLLQNQFLSKRYVMALSLTLMLGVPFALNDLLQRFSKRKMIPLMVGAAIIISAIGGILSFGYSKSYINDAGHWIALHIPQDAKLYANSYQLMYYSKHYGFDIFATIHQYTHIETIAQGRWKDYDYLALRSSKFNNPPLQQVLNDLPLRPLKVFYNKRGDQVAIYQVPKFNVKEV